MVDTPDWKSYEQSITIPLADIANKPNRELVEKIQDMLNTAPDEE